MNLLGNRLARTMTVSLLGLVSCGLANAAHLKQGEVVCRHQVALEQMQQANLIGDQNTVDWLFNGTVCMVVPQDTDITVIASTADGNQRVKTTGRRHNLFLWTHIDSLSPGSAQAAE